MMKKRWRNSLLWVLLLLILTGAVSSTAQRGYIALLSLADLAGHPFPAAFDIRPAIASRTLRFVVAQRDYEADSYQPVAGVKAGLLLVHGLIPAGKNDPRLQQFARALAKAGFFVLVPDIPTLRQLQLLPESVQEIADAFRYLKSNPRWIPENRLGIGAISVAVGPALKAKQLPTIDQSARFFLGIGGYYDLERILRYHTTGSYDAAEAPLRKHPNEYAIWAFVHSYANRLDNPSERDILRMLARRKLADPNAFVTDLNAMLGRQAHAILAFAHNRDPALIPRLMAQLPSRVRRDIAELNLANQDLGPLKGRFILVHGLDDAVIPAAESEALALALPANRTRLFLLEGFQHIESKPQALDAWTLWQALYSLLQEQHR